MRNYLLALVERSARQNKSNILSLLEVNRQAKLLDLGCDDGKWTRQLGNKIETSDIYGVEVVDRQIAKAKANGIQVVKSDINTVLPFENNYFDVIHANQVIEHLHNTDHFASEIYRMLKPGGYALISTENLSSWHNVFALICGFQPFSMTNYSGKGSIGNPFALWKDIQSDVSNYISWQHNRLFSYYGLKDLFQKHGFTVQRMKTAGYYPLWGVLANIDPIHGHWIVIKAKKMNP